MIEAFHLSARASDAGFKLASAIRCSSMWSARRRLAVACVIAGSLLTPGASSLTAATAVPGLPGGLPALPAIGERMSTDDLSGIALYGYDPVSYFVDGKPKAGRAEFEYGWGGAIWRFATAANREAFVAEPQVYAPLFDGYDAAAVAQGRIVESNPQAFAILSGRLYFFHSDVSRLAFLSDAALRRKSEQAWPDAVRQLAR